MKDKMQFLKSEENLKVKTRDRNLNVRDKKIFSIALGSYPSKITYKFYM